jgi:hypothetical protein
LRRVEPPVWRLTAVAASAHAVEAARRSAGLVHGGRPPHARSMKASAKHPRIAARLAESAA